MGGDQATTPMLSLYLPLMKTPTKKRMSISACGAERGAYIYAVGCGERDGAAAEDIRARMPSPERGGTPRRACTPRGLRGGDRSSGTAAGRPE